jgi:L-tyrosine peroxygenase
VPSVLLTDRPSCREWDFGDYPYALEPLSLPAPGAPDIEEEGGAGSDGAASYEEVTQYLRGIGEGAVSLDRIEPCETPEELYWFRWITGHQACFAIWRLMAQLQEEVVEGAVPLEPAFAHLSAYARGYSTMLLYTGSCPRPLYHALIRPSMRLRHRSFSGSWAPDYAPVQDLFRGQETRLNELPGADALARAVELYRLVHDGVAAKLVPDGKSLLRQSTVNTSESHELLGLLYDSYFLTLRAPVSHQDVVAQLLRRLVAIAQDAAVNAVDLDSNGDLDDRPAELRAPQVIACERLFFEILFEVATCAAEGAFGSRGPEGERIDVVPERLALVASFDAAGATATEPGQRSA